MNNLRWTSMMIPRKRLHGDSLKTSEVGFYLNQEWCVVNYADAPESHFSPAALLKSGRGYGKLQTEITNMNIMNTRLFRSLVLASAFMATAASADVQSAQGDATKMGAQMMNPGSALRSVEKNCKDGFKVLIYGNSIALHGPNAGIGWTNNWGMAASAPEKDFAHLVVAGLEAKLGRKAEFRIRNLAALERNFTTNISTVAAIAADARWKPDYVVVAIGENSPKIDESNRSAYRKFLADIARPFACGRAKVVLRSPFWMNAMKAKCTEDAAADVGAVYVDAGPLGFKDENKAIGLFAHRGVANHPGDLGMRRLADLILAGFDVAAPGR